MNDKNPDDIVDLILAQHQEAKKGLAEVSDANPEDRGHLFDALAKVLTAHEAAEEAAIYPTLRQLGDTASAMVKARVGEESKGKAALAKLQAMDASTDEFERTFEEFRAAVLEHATHEEVEIIPLLCSALTEQERVQMAAAFASAPS